jgi:hypothetical protein
VSALIGDAGAQLQLATRRVGLEAHARIVCPTCQLARNLSEQPLAAAPRCPGAAPTILEITRENASAPDPYRPGR